MALSVFAFVDSLFMPLVHDDDMAVSLGYWAPFTSGEVLHWVHLEPAFGGNRCRVFFRLVSPAEGG